MLPLLLLTACAGGDLKPTMDLVYPLIAEHRSKVILPDPAAQHLPDFQDFHITYISGSGHGGNLVLLKLDCDDGETIECWRVSYNGPSIMNRSPNNPVVLETASLPLDKMRSMLTTISILNQSRFKSRPEPSEFHWFVNEAGQQMVTVRTRKLISFSTADYALWLDIHWRGYQGNVHAFCDYPSSDDAPVTFLPNAQSRLLRTTMESIAWQRVKSPAPTDRERFDPFLKTIIHHYEKDHGWWWPMERGLCIAAELGTENLLTDIAAITTPENNGSGPRIQKLITEARLKISGRTPTPSAR